MSRTINNYIGAKHFANDRITLVPPLDAVPAEALEFDALPLFVDHPVTVLFSGKAFRVDQGGLYRFADFDNKRFGNIVYRSDDAWVLFESLCRIHLHGMDTAAMAKAPARERAAKYGKLVCTCGAIHGSVLYWFRQVKDLPLRRVQVMTLDDWNRWDNGHVLLEYYRADEKRWILVDIDTRTYYLDEHGRHLDVYGLTEAVNRKRPIVCRPICHTDGLHHTDGFLTYLEDVFDMESGKELWIRRVAQVPIVCDVRIDPLDRMTSTDWFPIENEEQKNLMLEYNRLLGTDFKPLPKSEWLARFYPEGRGE